MSTESETKRVEIPCRKYFEQRLLFFIDCKYFSGQTLNDEQNSLMDRSIMRASLELKMFDNSVEIMKNDGMEVNIVEREFRPDDLLESIKQSRVETLDDN